MKNRATEKNTNRHQTAFEAVEKLCRGNVEVKCARHRHVCHGFMLEARYDDTYVCPKQWAHRLLPASGFAKQVVQLFLFTPGVFSPGRLDLNLALQQHIVNSHVRLVRLKSNFEI